MNKQAEARIAPIAQAVFAMRTQKAEIEKQLKKLESDLKAEMASAGETKGTAGGYSVEIQKIAASRIVDADKLKADGLFDTYSKEKAGYDKLLVKKV